MILRFRLEVFRTIGSNRCPVTEWPARKIITSENLLPIKYRQHLIENSTAGHDLTCAGESTDGERSNRQDSLYEQAAETGEAATGYRRIVRV
jgi:hypothetical protein